MDYSKYQNEIFRQAKETTANLSVVAVAGSGKSTTLEVLVGKITHEDSVLVAAFNRDIVKDLTPRMRCHPLATVSTLNSFGNRILRQNVQCGEIDEDKPAKALMKCMDMNDEKERGLYWKWKNTFKRLADLLRANLIYEPESHTILDTLAEYNIDFPFKANQETLFLNRTSEAYNLCLRWKNMPDFRDQVFMPIYLNLPIPMYDWVLVDEDQDLDRCQAELMIRASRRLIMVGDPDQAIYRFRGAMADAVTQLEQRMNAVRLPLSVCYRCPKKIIERAKKLVPQIEACDWATEGIDEKIKLEAFRKQVKDGDLVICRCVKPLVTECLALIRLGRRAKVKGREIGTQLKIVIERLAEKINMPLGSFKIALDQYEADQMQRLGDMGKEQQMIDLSDRVETIRAIMESCGDTDSMLRKIDSIFTDNNNEPGIVMMSIHKAKGLENPRVFILAPELLPHPRAKTPEAMEDEKHLEYVAVTRVKFVRNSDGTVKHEGELYMVQSETKTQLDEKPLESTEAQPSPSGETVDKSNLDLSKIVEID